MERKLELKDIAGYLPYDLYGKYDDCEFAELITIGVCRQMSNRKRPSYLTICENLKPILRPISDLYKTITHNGKEIVPIIELAKMSFRNNRNHIWIFNEKSRQAFSNYYGNFYFEDCSFHIEDGGNVFNQVRLFDYLHELKIDYRGLIDAGLAIDCNTLENNPYK